MINNKDKTLEELRAKCETSLEAFLFSNTKPFVTKLFVLLKNVDSPNFINELYAEVGIENSNHLFRIYYNIFLLLTSRC